MAKNEINTKAATKEEKVEAKAKKENIFKRLVSRVKEFVKKHKAKLAASAGVALGGLAGFFIAKRKYDYDVDFEVIDEADDSSVDQGADYDDAE